VWYFWSLRNTSTLSHGAFDRGYGRWGSSPSRQPTRHCDGLWMGCQLKETEIRETEGTVAATGRECGCLLINCSPANRTVLKPNHTGFIVVGHRKYRDKKSTFTPQKSILLQRHASSSLPPLLYLYRSLNFQDFLVKKTIKNTLEKLEQC